MRYVVVGAGAVGGTIGGRLAQHGRDVLFIARGAHAQTMREHGFRFVTPQGEHRLDIPVVEGVGAAVLRCDDVLVLTVKGQHSPAVLADLAGLSLADGGSARELPVVCAQNGVENERQALRFFRRVYGMCVYLPATHLQPGVVVADGAPLSGLLDVGRYPEGVDDTAEQIAADLSDSLFASAVRPDIMRWKHGKLISNLTNALDALCDGAPGFGGLAERVRAEGRDCLAAAGLDAVPIDDVTDYRGHRVEVQPIEGYPRSGSSSRQSLARGAGSIESDYLNGEIGLLGRLHNVPTPVNDVLQAAASDAARRQSPPGSVTVEQLVQMIESVSAR